jgi:hypothetical protein
LSQLSYSSNHIGLSTRVKSRNHKVSFENDSPSPRFGRDPNVYSGADSGKGADIDGDDEDDGEEIGWSPFVIPAV